MKIKKYIRLVTQTFNSIINHVKLTYSNHNWLRILANPITIIGVIVVTMSLLNVSGSSIGIYDQYFDQGKSDPNRIVGNPVPIRSDEWLVNSQMITAQKSADYPYINKNIGNGQNMSLVFDVPYKDWSVAFKPQNLIFLIAPFSFAFAFKWWSLLFVLFCGAYFFALHFLPKKKIAATLLASIFTLSPFVQWWLTPQTTLILGFGFIIGLLIFKTHESKKEEVKKKVLLSLGLAYTMTCFALMLYPPFQIPCVIVIGLLYLSALIQGRKDKNSWISLIYIIGASTIALFIVGLFLLTRIEDVKSLLGTSYPGTRVIESGGVSLVHTLSTFVEPLLQNTNQAMLYTNNQSESSNFVIPYITLLLISVAIIIIEYKNKKKIHLPILAMLLIFMVFTARMTIPFGDAFYKLLFLSSIPNLRLFIGLGLISFVLLVLIVKHFMKEKTFFSLNTRWLIVLISSLAYSGLIFATMLQAPNFISSPFIALGLLFIMVLFTWLLVNKHIIWSLLLLLCFSLFSITHIHPLYKGTDILTKNPLSQFITSENNRNPTATWAVNKNIQLENFAVLNGAHSISGVYALPQIPLFNDLVPAVNNDTINRYAHVQFNFDAAITEPSIALIQADSFIVNISPCSEQLAKYNLRYLISTTPIVASCTTQVFDFATEKTDPTAIYVYKIQR